MNLNERFTPNPGLPPLEDLEALGKKNFYDRLRVSRYATIKQIEEAYWALYLQYKPSDDKERHRALADNHAKVCKLIKEAHTQLKDKREVYDIQYNPGEPLDQLRAVRAFVENVEQKAPKTLTLQVFAAELHRDIERLLEKYPIPRAEVVRPIQGSIARALVETTEAHLKAAPIFEVGMNARKTISLLVQVGLDGDLLRLALTPLTDKDGKTLNDGYIY